MVLSVLVAMLVAGCSPKATEVPSTVFKVAIVMPSSITDMAFSQSMFEGLKKVQAEMGGESAMEIAYSENMFKVPDASAAIRDYASKGYNLVIAHGSQYGTSLQQIAPDFPKTAFAWGTSWIPSRRKASPTCSPTRLKPRKAVTCWVLSPR